MKKILTFLMLLTFSALLFGCDGQENKFWETTYNNWNTYSQTEEYKPYLSRNDKIAYVQNNEDISATLSANEKYDKLITNYELLLDATMEVVGNIANTMEIKPLNTSSKIEKIYKKFEEKLNQLSNQISSFEIKKQDFASRIDLNDLESGYSLQLLKETKREMRSLLGAANEVKDLAIEIYDKSIKDYPTESVETISASTMRFLKLEQLGYLITAQVNYLNEFEIDKENYYDANILNKIEIYLDELQTVSDETFKVFENQKKYTERLKTETQFFLTSLEIVEMQNYFEDSDYLKDNQTLTDYINKVLYYINQ